MWYQPSGAAGAHHVLRTRPWQLLLLLPRCLHYCAFVYKHCAVFDTNTSKKYYQYPTPSFAWRLTQTSFKCMCSLTGARFGSYSKNASYVGENVLCNFSSYGEKLIKRGVHMPRNRYSYFSTRVIIITRVLREGWRFSLVCTRKHFDIS